MCIVEIEFLRVITGYDSSEVDVLMKAPIRGWFHECSRYSKKSVNFLLYCIFRFFSVPSV